MDRSILFYGVKGKRYCIWASPHMGFLTIHRKATEGNPSLPPQTYDIADYNIWDDPYWIDEGLHQVIAQYETDSTVSAMAPDLEPRLLASAVNAPEWALDLTDLEIAEAMRLRKLIEIMSEAETVASVRALLKGSASRIGPAPLRGALVAIALVCSSGSPDEQRCLSLIRAHAIRALERIPRYTPGYTKQD